MDKQIARAAIPGRDYGPVVPEGPPRRPRASARTVWAVRPWRTSSGRRLLAFRVRDDRVDVLVAGSPPTWVPAEAMLSEHAARRWLSRGFA